MKINIQPIRPKRISDQVYEELKNMIFRNILKPGDKLPPERELATGFGVSRSTVKLALQKLISQGLIEQRQGQGTFVRSSKKGYMENPLRQILSEDVSLSDLLEVRLGLEVNAAAIAAKRATKKDIELLEQSYQRMLANEDDKVASEEDVTFHMSISYATQNPAQVYTMKAFYDLLFYGIKENRFYLKETAHLPVITSQHKSILEGIKNRSPQEAAQAMKEHILFVMEFCKKMQL
ncbi:MAG: FadR/GntR family transcriptional regulator [Desulfonauticus sp.]|nr:FadR/GntR family transcriptional regulator [Desulfonauticus sp.]